MNHFVVTAHERFLKGRRQKALEAQKSSEEQNNADRIRNFLKARSPLNSDGTTERYHFVA